MAKQALLIGINRHRIPGVDLRGCVNDVANWRNALIKYYGFAAEDIVTLTDFDATKKAIQKGIAALISGGRAGDVLVLQYAGHGANVPDDNGDEADQRDEILCPTDLDWRDPLRDDWLRTTFDGVKPGVNLTVIMDCCHSGSNTRALQPPDAKSIPRYLPNPWDIMAEESGRRLRGRIVGELRGSTRAARRKSDVVHAKIPEVLITGCRDDQTSADAYINGSYNGALSYNLVASIAAAKGRLTYRQLHSEGTKRLKKGRFDQIPQLEGNKKNFDRPFLAPLA